MKMPSTGYYSVIQYCPDRSRMESANIGVLLYVEPLDYLKVRMASSNDRIRRFFNPDFDLDLQTINLSKRMVEHRLELEADGLRSRAEVEQFLGRFANEIVFTPLRPARVEDADAELACLFEELVSGRARRDPPMEAEDGMETVRRRFEQPDISGKLQRDIIVRVPVLDDQLKVDFGFQNGRFNLIQLKAFTQQRSEALLREACKTAAEGHLIYKHPDPERQEQQLVVVANFAEAAMDYSERISELMRDHDVDFYSSAEVDRLAEIIRTTAH